MSKFKIGDTVKPNRETSILKKDQEYIVMYISRWSIVIDMDVYGRLEYPEDWFVKVDEPSDIFDELLFDDAEMKQGSLPKSNFVLKSWTHFFQAIKNGQKKHDLRKMDRDFQLGQYLTLLEYDNISGEYTGQSLVVRITYITSKDVPCAFSSAVLDEGYAILSLEVVN